MPELKCTEIGCQNDARYLDRGHSYCEAHYKAEQQQALSVRWVYVAGSLLWLAIWGLIFGGVTLGSFPERFFFVDPAPKWPFLIPLALGIFVLVGNLLLWWKPGQYADYSTEVEVIEFVERNSSWFLIASGTFLTAAAFLLTRTQPPPRALPGLLPVLIFESASLVCLLLVVMLYWIPYQRMPRRLALLRHLKTVPFTYGVGFFAAAFIALVLSVASRLP